MRTSLALLAAALVLAAGPSLAALRTVVAEEFTGTWCPWCPSAMQGLFNLEQQVGDRLAVVAYHINDVFQVPGCTDRRTYYGITAYPTVVFDGVVVHVGGDVQPVNYMPEYTQREGIPSPVIIDIDLVTYDGSTGAGVVNVRVFNEPGNAPVSGALRCVAVGDDTLYSWQNFNHLYFTALHLFPSAAGVPIQVGPGQWYDVQLPFQIPSGWRDRSCTIVAFLQDDTTREILQGGLLGQVTPVELLAFEARTVRDGVLLVWRTASELENAGFMIRRASKDGDEVITNGLIPGAGTTAIPRTYEFVDRDVEPGTTYVYTLGDVSLRGVQRWIASVSVTVPPTWGTPSVLHLEPARPCPSRETVTLRWNLPEEGQISLVVVDLAGRVVRTLVHGSQAAGVHSLTWDLTDEAGTRVAPGVYLARLACAGASLATRIVVVD